MRGRTVFPSEQLQFFVLLMAPVLLIGVLVAANVSVRAALDTQIVVGASGPEVGFRENGAVARGVPPGVTVVTPVSAADEHKLKAGVVRPVSVLAYGVTRGVVGGASGELVRALRTNGETVARLQDALSVETLINDAPRVNRVTTAGRVVAGTPLRADVVQRAFASVAESLVVSHSEGVQRAVSLAPQVQAGRVWASRDREVRAVSRGASIVQALVRLRGEQLVHAMRGIGAAAVNENEGAGDDVTAAQAGVKLSSVGNAVVLGAAGFVVLADGDFRDISFERDQCVVHARSDGSGSARLVRSVSREDPAYGRALARAALTQTRSFVVYYDRYFSISYPMGDVPALYGVCTDVIVRAYRALGVDLQELVHKARIGNGDRSIAHRRVTTLKRFFERHADVLPVTDNPKDYLPGDIVTYHRPRNTGTRTHIGIVSDVVGPSGRPLLIHNRGNGPQLEDALFFDPITGHFRYRGPAKDSAQSVASRVQTNGARAGALRTR